MIHHADIYVCIFLCLYGSECINGLFGECMYVQYVHLTISSMYEYLNQKESTLGCNVTARSHTFLA